MINEPVRALSWKNPYAQLMLPPYNKIETRTWKTDYRGLVLLCCSKSTYPDVNLLGIAGLDQYNRIKYVTNNCAAYEQGLQMRGQAFAIGRLVDCRPMTAEDEDLCFVAYHQRLYCHVYEDVRPIEQFKWLGRRGWAKLTNEQKTLIKIKI